VITVRVGPDKNKQHASPPPVFRRGDHDWKETGQCQKCRRPIFTMRRGSDFALQRDPKCRCDVREVAHA
jgi:ribosomal protein S14